MTIELTRHLSDINEASQRQVLLQDNRTLLCATLMLGWVRSGP